MDIRQEIEAANRRTKAANQRQFVKRASDSQILENLLVKATAVVDAYERDRNRDYDGVRAAVAELKTSVALARRRG